MEVGYFVKLGISSDDRSIHHCTCQYGHGVDDLDFWGERILVEVGVSELDIVQELLTIGILCDPLQ